MNFARLGMLGLIVLLGSAACGGGDPETGSNAAASTTTTQAVITTEQPTASTESSTTTIEPTPTTQLVDLDGALALAESYVEGFNSHDAGAVTALLSDDAVLSNSFAGETPRSFWEEVLIWNIAQETVLTDSECSVVGPEGAALVVSCEHGTHDAVSQAVIGPPVPTVTTLTIEDGRIVGLLEEWSSPDFNQVRDPFRAWLEIAHPDVFEAGTLNFRAWSDAEEAEAFGALIPQYADEWASHLETNGCIYLDDC